MENLYIIKIGGETINKESSLNSCISALANSGKNIILVHGGGKRATEVADKLGIHQQMVEGRRITSHETLEVVTMVYAGLISKNVVAKLSSNGKKAIGLSGADLQCVISKKRSETPINYGFVGDVKHVDAEIFLDFVSKNIIPVVCSISLGEKFELLNTNADTMAAEIAKAMAKNFVVHLVYCFEKNGVLTDISDDNSVLPELSQQDFVEMKNNKQIADGMIPKLQTAFQALFHGVEEARIINSNFLENYFNGEQTGTAIKLH